MRFFLLLAMLAFSILTHAAGSGGYIDGEAFDQAKDSPFSPRAFSGGRGVVPDPSGVKEIAEVLAPYLSLKGDLGFLEISRIFSVATVSVSERYEDGTTLMQTYPLKQRSGRDAVLLRLQDSIHSAKSAVGLSSIVACVRGSFWNNGRSHEYEACYLLNHNGEWIQTSYRHWPVGVQEP